MFLRKFSSCIVVLLFCSYANTSIAQASVEKGQFKINVLLLGLVYEHGLSTKNTFYTEVNSGVGYSSNMFGDTWSFYPTLISQFRHYYNLEKRIAKSKTIAKNTGSFVAFQAAYTFESINTNKNFWPSEAVIAAGPVWGFQRTYNKNFNLDLSTGILYYSKNSGSGLTPTLNFSLGWVIGK